ncbi:MAG: translation initiation factor, partial [Planctomycetota bacterium]
MSKKAQLRIHQLAKELGVNSKDIVAKCQAEEIPDITNHMSPVSVGLAQTIREWFGAAEGAVATAVETAEPVDLEALAPAPAKPARKRAAKKKAEPEAEPESEEAPAAVAPTAPEVKAPEPVVAAAEPKKKPAAAAPEAPAAVAPAAKKVSEPAAEEAPGEPVPPPTMNVPQRPKLVGPVGPQVQPKRVELSGPRVIRIEEPESLPAPRPRRTPLG